MAQVRNRRETRSNGQANGHGNGQTPQTPKKDPLDGVYDSLLAEDNSHREHLAFDNEFDDSAASSPTQGFASPAVGPSDGLLSPSIRPGVLSRTQTDTTLVSSKSLDSPAVIVEKRGPKSKTRYRFRNVSKLAQESILESKASRTSTFFGFYTLFWITVAVVIIRGLIHNYLASSQIIGYNIPNILRRDLLKIALTDLGLYLSTYFVVFWQLGIKAGILDWDSAGWIIEHVWQAGFIVFILWFNEYMKFPWIGCVFLVLHGLVLIMKQHSYAFYNGYFWGIKRELQKSQAQLKKLQEEPQVDEEVLEKLQAKVDFCAEEIRMQSETVEFPANISLYNYFQYSMFPTVVYQVEYPRTEKIRWTYVLEKTCATFGVFLLMIIVAENYLYPIAMRSMALRDHSLYDKVISYPLILLDLIPPFMLMYLLVFYIIWDAILNGIAELTRFGDRQFYGEWWNCVTWDQFAKDWNTPVHRFLLRHVYHSSISSFHISKAAATFATFLLSSFVHELVMFCIFKKLRGYLLFLQMCQLPLIWMSRTRFMKERHVLGNVIFWIGIVTGPSIMCSLYLTF